MFQVVTRRVLQFPPIWTARWTFFFSVVLCRSIQVLERVALAYPRALFYPLLMTKASAAARRGGGGGADDGQRLSKLTALTFDASGEAFAEVK